MKTRRNANYKLLGSLEAFEAVDSSLSDGTHGNIEGLVNGEIKRNDKKEYKYVGGAFKGGKSIWQAISAPFLLAKLVASFRGIKIETHGQNAYKITWMAVLKHKESGAIITFYDWKGGASIGSNLNPDEVTPELKKDLFALVRALADPHFPHPYDGCSIGEVA